MVRVLLVFRKRVDHVRVKQRDLADLVELAELERGHEYLVLVHVDKSIARIASIASNTNNTNKSCV